MRVGVACSARSHFAQFRAFDNRRRASSLLRSGSRGSSVMVLLVDFAERLASAGQKRFNRFRRIAASRGNFVYRKLIQILRAEHGFVVLGQSRQRRGHALGLFNCRG